MARTMKPLAEANFTPFLLQCGEGCVDYLYGDRHTTASGQPDPIVTTAVGCALFTVEAALSLDWRLLTGQSASSEDIRHDWNAVLQHPELAAQGAKAYRPFMACRLKKSSIDELVHQRITQFEVSVRLYFPGYDTAPDKAQEGLLRLMWATGGANFAVRWPRFTAAFNAEDWATCADESAIPHLIGEPNANALEAYLFKACAAGAGDYPK